MEKWNELCYMLSENLPSNVNEQLFEIKVIQAFEKLGWRKFNHKIGLLIGNKIQIYLSKEHSQWFEVPANNDRPYYDRWLKKMRNYTIVQNGG